MSSKQPSSDVIDAPNLTTTTRSGRAAQDERGNSIWEWQTAPGVFSREISAQQLEALEATNLSVLDLDHASVRPVSGHLHVGSIGRRQQRKADYKSAFDKLLSTLGLPR